MNNAAQFIVLLAMAASAHVHANDPDAIRAPVGSALINGDSLKPFENSWRMEVTRKDGTTNHDAGLWRDRFEVIDIDGKAYGVRIQDAAFKNAAGQVAATTRTVNVFERRTMAPVTRSFERHVTGQPDSSVHVAFKPNAMTLQSSRDGKSERKKPAVVPAFDFDGGMYALLWSAFPLKPGFAASLPSYSEDEHPEKVVWYTFTVTGTERIDAGHQGQKECFVVEGGSGSGPLKYWMSADPPYIIQLQFEQAATGMTWLLRMT